MKQDKIKKFEVVMKLIIEKETIKEAREKLNEIIKDMGEGVKRRGDNFKLRRMKGIYEIIKQKEVIKLRKFTNGINKILNKV